MSNFCQNCGAEQLPNNTLCTECGKTPFITFKENDNSELDTVVKVVSFCVPLIGGILYFVHKNSAPQKSKDACTSASWGIVIGILIQIIATAAGV
tara:strand:- start:77 stop:361 length:285 start_codon:yes stop_codon:yes gene_type:complete